VSPSSKASCAVFKIINRSNKKETAHEKIRSKSGFGVARPRSLYGWEKEPNGGRCCGAARVATPIAPPDTRTTSQRRGRARRQPSLNLGQSLLETDLVRRGLHIVAISNSPNERTNLRGSTFSDDKFRAHLHLNREQSCAARPLSFQQSLPCC
jgi:hypothetical protein